MSICLLNLSPKVRCVREDGREFTDWLKYGPKVRWVSVGGSDSTG